jgi:hypothetical protein
VITLGYFDDKKSIPNTPGTYVAGPGYVELILLKNQGRVRRGSIRGVVSIIDGAPNYLLAPRSSN